MPDPTAGPVDPSARQGAGLPCGAAGLPYKLPAPCRPAALSYDPLDAAMADVHRRFVSDPGRVLKRGESWVGHCIAWWAGPWGVGGAAEGWRRVVPCVALLSCEGELVRAFGWDAYDTFAAAVCTTDRAADVQGIDMHIRSCESPAGDHWWLVIDRLGPDGEIPTMVVRNESDGQANQASADGHSEHGR